MPLIYRDGSLFDAPKGSLLVHACNTVGVWGSGIAAQFRDRFPVAHEKYVGQCKASGRKLLGDYARLTDGESAVGCLFVSAGYGSKVDKPQVILKHTRLALAALVEDAAARAWDDSLVICSNKFNSGLFAVPWEHTEKALLDALAKHPEISWIVYNG